MKEQQGQPPAVTDGRDRALAVTPQPDGTLHISVLFTGRATESCPAAPARPPAASRRPEPPLGETRDDQRPAAPGRAAP
jgi:hypothetical protein